MAQGIVRSLEHMLDYCTQKQKVLSKNIANIGTEGYQREDLKFESILSKSMSGVLKTSNEKHFQVNNATETGGFEIIDDKNSENVSGINNVDVDTEMAEMAENTLKFKFASRKIGDYYRGIQNVIRGGSGR